MRFTRCRLDHEFGGCADVTLDFAQKVSSWTKSTQPAAAGEGIKPGVKRSGTPGTVAAIIHSSRSGRQWKHHGCLSQLQPLSAAPRAGIVSGFLTWGFAALHPRLYAVARSRGLVLVFTDGGFLKAQSRLFVPASPSNLDRRNRSAIDNVFASGNR